MSRPHAVYRAVDLARLAGISTQQVRNYAAAGILPPVPRTATGYRQFDDTHRRALQTYRALAAGCGPRAAQAIMRAVHANDIPHALALLDAAHADLHEQRNTLRATSTALEAATEHAPRSPAPPNATGMRIGHLAADLGIRTSALRTREAAGLLTPARDHATNYRRYRPTDVRDAHMIYMLRQAHYLFPQIRPILEDLRRSGSTDALREAVTTRQSSLTQRAAALLEASSHLHHYLTTEPPEQLEGEPVGSNNGNGREPISTLHP